MDSWSKEEIQELRNFWKSEVGKKYIKRMKDTKKELLHAAMGSVSRDDVCRYVAIANGFDSVLQDIEMATKEEKEEQEKTAKK